MRLGVDDEEGRKVAVEDREAVDGTCEDLRENRRFLALDLRDPIVLAPDAPLRLEDACEDAQTSFSEAPRQGSCGKGVRV